MSLVRRVRQKSQKLGGRKLAKQSRSERRRRGGGRNKMKAVEGELRDEGGVGGDEEVEKESRRERERERERAVRNQVEAEVVA